MPCLALPEPPPANLAPTPPHRTGLFFSLTPPVHQKPRTPAQNLCYPPAPPEITRALTGLPSGPAGLCCLGRSRSPAGENPHALGPPPLPIAAKHHPT